MACPAKNDLVLSGFVTIDHSTGLFDALGMLKKARAMYPDAASHADRESALENCLRAGVSEATIVGYGEPGIAYTGSGCFKGREDRYIGPDNFGLWCDDIRRFRQPGAPLNLTLCCCYTGVGYDAPDVLHRLAKEVNGAVCAPTGMVLYDHITNRFDLADDTKWQTATPTDKPDVVAVLHPHETGGAVLSRDDDRLRGAAVRDRHHQRTREPVRSRAVHRLSPATVPLAEAQLRYVDATGAIPPQIWRGDDVFTRLPYFGVADRRVAKGCPLGVCTGRVELTIQTGRRAKEVRVFDVLSDRVLSDTKFPNVYYYANIDELRASLEQEAPEA